MPTLTPYVMVEDARRFIAFIEEAFHAEIGELVPLDSDTNRVIHGVAKVGDTTFYFADSGPDGGQCLKTPEQPAHIQLHLQLDDPEAAHKRGIAAGANSALPVTEPR